jgi:outer membrane lipoprotein SlyB
VSKRTITFILAGGLALSACQSGSTSQTVAERNAEFYCVAGTVGGAIVGGLLGSTIGAGTGQVAAIGIGIGGGGILGNRLACGSAIL